jgi:hypothetical protein
VLRGGFGTPENGWVLRWLNSESSRFALGYEATARWLEQLLLTCHPSHRSAIEARIGSARRGHGPTLFDEIVNIIRDHGPGGDESEDGILLELFCPTRPCRCSATPASRHAWTLHTWSVRTITSRLVDQ